MCMKRLLIWTSMANDEITKRVFEGVLWGYPDLVETLFEVVGPALVEERQKKIRQREEAEEKNAATEHSDDSLVTDVADTNHDKDGTAPVSIAFLYDQLLGYSNAMHRVVQQNGQSQPESPPPTSCERILSTLQAIESAFANPIQQMDVPWLEDEASVPNGNKEATSMLEDTVEGPYNGQNYKDAGE